MRASVRGFDMIPDRDALKPADVAKDVAVAAACVFFLSFIFHVGVVNGNSMSPSLHDGDVVVYSSTTGTGLRRGDIVVFESDCGALVKRVVGLPGDNIVVEGGVVYLDGDELSESYTAPGFYGPGDVEYPITIPSGCYFVMGDNRPYSRDSRMRCVGMVHDEDVLGVVRLIL